MLERPTLAPPRERSARTVAIAFQVAFALGAAVLLGLGSWPRATIAAALVPVMWAPALLEHLLGRPLPTHLSAQLGAFLAAGPCAGSAFGLYSALPGWDKVVHADSGVLVAVAGVVLVRSREASVRPAAALLVQASAMAVAAAWEIAEYTSDQLFGTQAQHGNGDTMTDIIAGTAGAAVVLVATWALGRRRGRAPDLTQ